MAKAIDIYIGKINSGQELSPVVVNGSGKAAEFLKAQEVKPGRKARPRKPEQAPAETGRPFGKSVWRFAGRSLFCNFAYIPDGGACRRISAYGCWFSDGLTWRRTDCRGPNGFAATNP